MTVAQLCPVAVTSICALLVGAPLLADSHADSVELVVVPGRPIRVALDERVTLKRVGQRVVATVVDPIYAYDRVVVPAGTKVFGHVARLDGPSRAARARGILGGDFSPNREVLLEFDAIRLTDGRELAVRTAVGPGTERVTLQVAASPTKADAADDAETEERVGVADRARQEVAQARREAVQRARDAVAAIKSPGKMERLKTALIEKLPYHPQFLSKGSVYNAALIAPLDFGATSPITPAPGGVSPAPESILSARLVTEVDSSKSVKGAAVAAILSEPVFSAEHQLIFPEGTELTGEVTFVRKARRFHRNGQLRFLFQSIRSSAGGPRTLPASLYSVQVGESDRVEVDEEGGAQATSSKTRFIAPALALLSLRASLDHDHHGLDHDADDSLPVGPSNHVGSLGVGGFFGWGLAGTAVSLVSRPAGIALGVIGAARTVYSSIFGKGREVSFQVDTPIQVQLAPGPATKP